jgi:hypothetical protein
MPEVLKPCEHCQKYKNVQCGHGENAPREAGLLPWSEVTGRLKLVIELRSSVLSWLSI